MLRLLKIYEDELNVYLVLEYQPKGTLLNMIEDNQQISEQTTRVIMEQLLLTLDFFQKHKVIHSDIKLDNILVSEIEENTNYDIRVADFGLSVFTPNDEMLTERCGTPGYIAPELL